MVQGMNNTQKFTAGSFNIKTQNSKPNRFFFDKTNKFNKNHNRSLATDNSVDHFDQG